MIGARDDLVQIRLAREREFLIWSLERERRAVQDAEADARHEAEMAKQAAKAEATLATMARRADWRSRAEAGDLGALKALHASRGWPVGDLDQDDAGGGAETDADEGEEGDGR